MNKPRVYATHPLFEPARNLLEARCEVDYWRGPARPTRATLLEHVPGKNPLICLLTKKIKDEVLDAGRDLKIVANVAVGFDNIDVPACTRHKVFASNTPGVLDETTADFAWTLLMAVARRLLEGDRLSRSGQWTGWDLDQLCGGDIWGKTLGLVGFGRIGRAVAREFACGPLRQRRDVFDGIDAVETAFHRGNHLAVVSSGLDQGLQPKFLSVF